MEFKKMWISDNSDGTYTNPVLYTDYSDPDMIRVGDDYYMIASSFCNSPAIPLLHSKDMVNWKVINYVLDHVPGERFFNPEHGCGVWAPAIRYHNDTFYVCFPMPDEGIFMCTSKDPYGRFSEPVCIKEGKGYIDPCPFWDEDGKAYLVTAFARSRIGFKSILHLTEIAPDGMSVIGEGVHIFDGNETQPTIEGPKLYKRNGYYYIFAPAGGVKTGWQTVLRSKNIWGPYEEKIVMRQGDSDVNGPHQGAYVTDTNGDDWFLHFQDVYAAGRIIHLQPMHWENDWPIIGIAKDGNDYGEPVKTYKKPNNLVTNPYCPDDSDDFNSDTLGLQWQWNANYSNEWYDTDQKNSRLILYPVHKETTCALADTKNLLLQKWTAPEFSTIARLNVSDLATDDCAGFVSLGVIFGGLGVKKTDNAYNIISIRGSQTFHNEKATSTETITTLETVNKLTELYIRYTVKQVSLIDSKPSETITFEYSFDGINYTKAEDEMEAVAGRWVGVKCGLFCYNTVNTNSDGKLYVNSFIFEK